MQVQFVRVGAVTQGQGDRSDRVGIFCECFGAVALTEG
jgi:hypothetical protein